MPDLTKKQTPCPHCHSADDWYTLPDGRYRCPTCLGTLPAPKPPAKKRAATKKPGAKKR